MDDKQIRIANLKAQITDIHQTIYPENYSEVKMVMLNALRDRVYSLEKNEADSKNMAPVASTRNWRKIQSRIKPEIRRCSTTD